MIKKTFYSATSLALALGLAVGTSTSPAAAASTTNTVQIVQYWEGSLLLQLNGAYYYAQTSSVIGAACSARAKNIETLKIWQNLGTAALLAGRSVLLTYTTCNGYNYIDLINLNG